MVSAIKGKIGSDWWSSARSMKMTVQVTTAQIAAIEIVAPLASQVEGKDILKEWRSNMIEVRMKRKSVQRLVKKT